MIADASVQIPCDGNYWLHTVDAAITGYNERSLTDVSVEQCKTECVLDPFCESFDYNKAGRYCYIQYTNSVRIPTTQNALYDSYSLWRFSNVCNVP